ncbi:MAG: alpha-L-fucosidase [Actinomycetota bacterium]
MRPGWSEATPSNGWFDGARFGMFIHWTHIAQRGLELSWPLVGGIEALPEGRNVAVDDYYAKALDFCPDRGAPREWMRRAKQAGMRYAILTTKHHDGFALWPTKLTDFSIAQTPYEGDLVAEYVDAARAEGLRVGFYYSLSDWHHPDYPPFREEDKPYPKFLGRRSDSWNRYLDVMFGQVEELLTNYGQIDVLWFDGQWERTVDEWRAPELIETIRELQPDILINDRLPGGDYETPEQGVPEKVPAGRWETCMTMNRSWGYVPGDTAYKSSTELIHTLCEVTGKGGNFLLNVSPRSDGSLPPEQIERLETVGSWMAGHADAIHDTGPGLEPWQFYGPSTRKNSRIFLHAVMRPYESVVARGIPIRRVASARHLASGVELDFRTRATVQQELFSGDPIGEVFVEVPEDLVEPYATVVELTILPPA